MKKLMSVPNLSTCDVLKSLLESYGIQCFIKNESMSRLAGALPYQEVMPELWVIDDEQFEKALGILSEAEC